MVLGMMEIIVGFWIVVIREARVGQYIVRHARVGALVDPGTCPVLKKK